MSIPSGAEGRNIETIRGRSNHDIVMTGSLCS